MQNAYENLAPAMTVISVKIESHMPLKERKKPTTHLVCSARNSVFLPI